MTKTAPKSPLSPAAVARRQLLSPSGAADAARLPGSLAPALAIYAVFLLATALFYSRKPFDFPDRNAAFPRETQNLAFWLKVMVWQPPLEAAWIVFLTALVEWFRRGRLALRLMGATLATALPFVLIILYYQSVLSWGVFAAAAVCWLAALTPLLRRAPAEQWRAVTSFMLALNVIGLTLLVPMKLAISLDSSPLYTGSQIAGGLWILLTGTLGLRALTGLRLPRCFMSVLLSMFLQIAFALTLHFLGVVPKEILKALLYA